MKKYFITGLLSLLPLAITLFVLAFLLNFLTRPFVGMVENFLVQIPSFSKLSSHHDALLWVSRLIALILLCIMIFLLGFCVQKLFLRFFVELTHKIFQKIPLVGTIYKSTKQIAEVLFAEKEKFFKKSVIAKFPHEGSYCAGFLSSEAPAVIQEKLAREKGGIWQTVFIPTAPHPISGFVLIVAQEDIHEIEMKTEDLFKFLISCGTFHPDKS